MKLQLLHNRVLIKPETKADISEGGIIIPDTAQKAP